MKNKTFTLAFVLSFIAALAYGFIAFLGYNFMWLGDINKSILASIGIITILLIIVLILTKVKASRRNYRKNAILEIVLLGIYTIVVILVLMPFAHYFTVQEKKDSIKANIVADIDSVRKMFEKYEENAEKRKLTYSTQMQIAINGYNLNRETTDFPKIPFKVPGENLQSQKTRNERIFEDDLMPDIYDSTKAEAMRWLAENEKNATPSKPIGLVGMMRKIHEEAQKWKKEMIAYDTKATQAKVEPSFDYKLSSSSIELELTNSQSPSLIALILAVLIHLLVLLPYWVGNRDGDSKGLFWAIFSNNKNIEFGGKL